MVGTLQSSQPLSTELLLTNLVNEPDNIRDDLLLVLDDSQTLDSGEVHQSLAYLVEHLAIISREDPPLPLARLRARGQLMELRAADLR